MKKNIFIILVSTLLILVLIYLYDTREKILNKQYQDYKNNITINYPYFNNITVDNYLTDYLKSYIEEDNLLFIDYDYKEINDKIELMIYIYKEKENIVQKEIRKIDLDVDKGIILKNSRVVDASIEYDIYNQSIININKPMIALTFDDGPNHNTSRILDILEKYNVKATFFLLGTNIKGNEKTIERMNKLGMELGNHMYSHKLLTKLKDEEITSEIEKVDRLIFDITGKYPKLVRPSYGTINKRIKKIIDKPIILWNKDTLDWKYHNSNRIANKLLKNVSDGDVILMHDIYRATANSLEIIIPKLLEQNYQLVTVSELLYYKGMRLEKGNVYTNVK